MVQRYTRIGAGYRSLLWPRPVCLSVCKQAREPVPNLLEDSWVALSPLLSKRGVGKVSHQRPYGAADCCPLFLLMCALLMTSSHWKVGGLRIQLGVQHTLYCLSGLGFGTMTFRSLQTTTMASSNTSTSWVGMQLQTMQVGCSRTVCIPIGVPHKVSVDFRKKAIRIKLPSSWS